jgi:hypothetical protein
VAPDEAVNKSDDLLSSLQVNEISSVERFSSPHSGEG